MIDIEDLKDSFSNFAHEKPVIFTVIVTVIFLFFAGLIILIIQTTPVKKIEVVEQEPFEQDAPILIPDAPDIEKEYYQSRITENQWSKEDINRWFTFPEEDSMNELRKSNDKIVEDILNAAP